MVSFFISEALKAAPTCDTLNMYIHHHQFHPWNDDTHQRYEFYLRGAQGSPDI